MILFQNFKRQWSELEQQSLEVARNVGQTGWYILGQNVQQFEKELAQKTGFSFCEGVGNGMDAIEISLRALGLRKGEKVLTTPLSAFATTLAIVRAGGIPVFCDTDANGLLDLDAARNAIQDHQIKYMVPVHLFGQLMDIGRLNQLKKEFDLKIVEDAAQAICAHNLSNEKTLSEAITVSFYPTKNLGALGDGGALLTNDSDLAKKASMLKNYGQSDKYIHDYIGMNSRLDEIQGAFLSLHLKYLDTWHERRKTIADFYLQGIENKSIRTLNVEKVKSTWHLFPVFLPSLGRREDFIQHMLKMGIQTSIHYPLLINKQKALMEVDKIVAGNLNVAENITNTVVSLPLHPYLNDEEVNQVINACNQWQS